MYSTAIEEKKQLIAEEYLRLERKSLREKTGKHEFFNRKRIFIAGGTHTHNKTVFNVGFALGLKNLQSKLNLDITTSETKVVSFLTYKNYFYPDIVVVDGKPYFEDGSTDVMLNPTLLIEVLSETTEAFDRGDKFTSYRQIKSLKEYILISSTKRSVEQFYCNEAGQWQIGSVFTEGSVSLKSLPITLEFEEIYQNVEFDTVDTTVG